MRKFGQGALCVLIATALASPAIAAPCAGTVDAPPLIQGMPLTLDMALRQVRNAAPEVQRAALETRARQADADQAGRRLNPSVGLDIENFAGSGPLSGFDQTETTLSFEQTFQLGGKRETREQAARAQALLGEAECQALMRAAQLEAANLFFEIIAAQEVWELAKQSSDLAATLSDTVAKRVEAGAAAPPEFLRAKADAASLKAATLAAKADIDRKRFELSSLWGSEAPKFAELIYNAPFGGSATSNLRSITSHPELASAKAAEDVRRAEQLAARAAGVPDVTVSAGIRRFGETGDNGFLLGVRVPFPVFDKNRDATRASGLRAESARISAMATESRLKARQNSAALQLSTARERVNLLENEALPAAQAAYEASVKGYTAGRFDLTTTLNAQKDLIDAGVAVIAARRTFNNAQADLKSLIGAPPFTGDF